MKIVLAGLFYPFAILSYFRRALERRQDVELFTVVAHTGQYIPWAGGMNIPLKYPNTVDLPLPSHMLNPKWEQIEKHLPWAPDLCITVDAGWWFASKPSCWSAHIATDPHVLNYDRQRKLCDKFYNMQPGYMRDGDTLLYYAFDPECHYPETSTHTEDSLIEVEGKQVTIRTVIADPKEYDCSIIGLHYPQRDEWVSRLRAKGVKVNYRIGDIYDEYRRENNKAWIGLNWSSLEDVTARVFEIMAMRLVPIINRLPGLDELGFEDGRHYLGFSNMDEAVEKVLWAKNNPDFSKQIALEAYQFVHNHDMTYDNRIRQILSEFGV